MSIPLAIATAARLYATRQENSELNAMNPGNIEDSTFHVTKRGRTGPDYHPPPRGSQSEAEYFGYTGHKRRKKGVHYYVVPHPQKKNRFVTKYFYMPRRSFRRGKRRYRSRRRGGRRRVNVTDLTTAQTARATHFNRVLYRTAGRGGTEMMKSDGSLSHLHTMGQSLIALDRLRDCIAYGNNTADDTMDTVLNQIPTAHDILKLMFQKYTVVQSFIQVTFTNVRRRPTNAGNATITDQSDAVQAYSQANPILVGGYIDDTNWAAAANGLTNLPTASANSHHVKDMWLQPMSKMRMLQPGQSATMSWRISPFALHGKFDLNDNELTADDISSRGTHPTNLRLIHHPIRTGGSGGTSDLGAQCLVDIRVYRKAVWSDRQENYEHA